MKEASAASTSRVSEAQRDPPELPPVLAEEVSPRTFYRYAGKRLFDFTTSLVGLIILSPALLAIAVTIRLTSRGPALFKQTRTGPTGKSFTLYKFRTMRISAADQAECFTFAGDPRITPFGAFLRRLKFDELPQLVNILLGDMSFVGPRPHVPELLGDLKNVPLELTSLRPGLTGLSTLCHRTEEAILPAVPPADRTRFYLERWLPRKQRLDLLYARKMSLWLDLKLILLTLLLLFFPGSSKDRDTRILGIEFNLFSRRMQQAIDLTIFVLAVTIAFWMRFEGNLDPVHMLQLQLFLILLPLARLLVNRGMGIYDLVWRYISLSDAILIFVSLAAVSGVLVLLRLTIPRFYPQASALAMPLTVICAEFLVSGAGALGVRILRRNLYETEISFQPQNLGPLRVLLVGAGFLGSTVARQMRRYPDFDPIGFVDDDVRKLGTRISGLKVLGTTSELIPLAKELHVDQVFLCLGNIDEARVRSLQNVCADSGLRATVIPDLIALLGQG